MSWRHRRPPCPHCPLPGWGADSVSAWESLRAWPLASSLEFQVGLWQTFAMAHGRGNRGLAGCSAWRRNARRRGGGGGGTGTGRGVLATYLRDRRNVHSLAQPTGETRGVGGSGPPPSWPQGSALPAGLSLRQLPSPERLAQGREERLATASSGTSPRGDPCDEHPSSRGSTSGGCSGIVGSQQGPAWHSLDFTRRWCCSIEKGDGPPSPGAVLYHLAEVSDAPDLEGA